MLPGCGVTLISCYTADDNTQRSLVEKFEPTSEQSRILRFVAHPHQMPLSACITAEKRCENYDHINSRICGIRLIELLSNFT